MKSFKSSGSYFKDFQRKLDLYDKDKPRTCGLLKDAPGFKNVKLYLYDKEKTRNTFSRLSPDKNNFYEGEN